MELATTGTSAEVVVLRAGSSELLQHLDATDNKVRALQSSFVDMQAAASQAGDVEEQGRRRQPHCCQVPRAKLKLTPLCPNC